MDKKEAEKASKPLNVVEIVTSPEEEGEYGCCGWNPR